jgi:choline-sulfatase
MISGQGNIWDASVSSGCEGYLWNRSKDQPFLMVASFLQPHDICGWLKINSHVPDKLRYSSIEPELPDLPANFQYDPNEPIAIQEKRQKIEGVKNNWTEEHWQYYRWSYFRHIEMVDSEIGRLLRALEETGYNNNTMIIFTADHGEGLAHHQMVRKSLLYDEAVKVPLLISLPGHIPQNVEDTHHLVSGIDIMPTLCDYAGIEMPNNVQGLSLRPVLEGSIDTWRIYVVSEVSSNTGRMVRTKQYKYIVYKDDPVEQLFDIIQDPGETHNLTDDDLYASVVEEHRRLLKEWEQRLIISPDIPETDAWWYPQNTEVKTTPSHNHPTELMLYPNYPNPFNPSTAIEFSLPQTAKTKLEIISLDGMIIDVLIDSEQSKGKHTVHWQPEHLTSGTYVCRLQSAGQIKTHKMIYMK